ncbi:MAG: ABC transporter ATP-binding protein [Planctomycetota bacterium]
MSDRQQTAKEGAAVRVRGLSFGWTRRPVLKGVDLDVRRGEAMALVGANGAGKSTLLALLAGAEPYRSRWRRTRSTVEVLGMDPVREGHRVRGSVGYVPERTDLPRWMRIRDHLRLVGAIHPLWSDAEAARWLDAFQLDPALRYAELSKGQRMLENLAAALALRPPLLLLDEPFSGLDAVARRLVTDGLIQHMCDHEATVLLVSHSISDIERCADRVALFVDGRVARVGSVDELKGETETADLEDAVIAAAAAGRAA